ncbi:MAG: FecR domain-containing protein [Proteobacteria bacterium]|nr:FecR domain-containing protein [Pseudomonadota bacterium]
MSRNDANAGHSERRQAAAAWLVRLENDEATGADWAAFERWLTDPENRKAIDEIESALAIVDDHRSAFAAPLRTKRSGGALRTGVFATLAMAAAVLLFVELQPAPARTFDYAAPSNAVRIVQLPDGGTLTLNRSAVAHLQWSSAQRRAILIRGEAAFRVIHNENAPFTVIAGPIELRDIGTEFNVLRTPGAVTVTVREGALDVSSAAKTLRLSAGDQATADGGRLSSRRVHAEDAFAWRDGRLIYRDAPLSAVVADLNRYGATPITIADRAAAALRFSGVLVIDTPATMTSRLEAFLPVRSEHNAAGIVIRSR